MGGSYQGKHYLKVELIPFVVGLNIGCGREELKMTLGLWARLLVRVLRRNRTNKM